MRINIMNQYFSAIQVHLQEKCLLDCSEQCLTVATMGVDNMLNTFNVDSGEQNRYTLDHPNNFQAMALSPRADHAIIGGRDGQVLHFDFIDNTANKILDTVGFVTDIKYAPSGRYIAVGSQQGKTLIYQPQNQQKSKCRPGHSGAICHLFLSKDEQFLASTGQDKYLLIYDLAQIDQPQQVARYTVTKLDQCWSLIGSFHWHNRLVYAPGMPQLQKIQLIQGKWEYSRSNMIKHRSQILMTQTVKKNTLVTSSRQQVCIWNILQQQKLFQIEQFNLSLAVPLAGKFFGVRDDGKLYKYMRELRQEQPMQIQHDSQQSKLEFEVNQEQPQPKPQQQQQQIQLQFHKKSKAQKIITCFPQGMVSTATSYFQSNRFLFVNGYGCVIERQQGQQQTILEVQFSSNNNKTYKISNKNYKMFDINRQFVVFASDMRFGLMTNRDSLVSNWELEWKDIQAIAMGVGWIAVANDQLIKVFDMFGHQVKSIAFDRQIVAMKAYENMLAIVFHQGVPMWGSQQLALQLYFIDSQQHYSNLIATIAVPIKPGCQLRWIDFSQEGMLFGQDTVGNIRSLSLQTNQWTKLTVDGVEQNTQHKIWLIAFSKYRVHYWKTSQQDPQPTVSPRFNIKNADLCVQTIGVFPQNTQSSYQRLLWNRYCLDHEKARSRMWGRLKLARPADNPFYYLTQSIMTQRQTTNQHRTLDEQYYPIVQNYIKANQSFKALHLAKSCIRSIQSLRSLSDLFDYYKQRNMAIQLQNYCEQLQKQLQYEQMQTFQFIRLREQAERTIQPRNFDPMRRVSKKNVESLPSFSQSMNGSQVSQSRQSFENRNVRSSNHSQVSAKSQVSNNSEVQGQKIEQNPFQKKKSNHESLQAKKKEIIDNVEKFGIKKKVDERMKKGR